MSPLRVLARHAFLLFFFALPTISHLTTATCVISDDNDWQLFKVTFGEDDVPIVEDLNRTKETLNGTKYCLDASGSAIPFGISLHSVDFSLTTAGCCFDGIYINASGTFCVPQVCKTFFDTALQYRRKRSFGSDQKRGLVTDSLSYHNGMALTFPCCCDMEVEPRECLCRHVPECGVQPSEDIGLPPSLNQPLSLIGTELSKKFIGNPDKSARKGIRDLVALLKELLLLEVEESSMAMKKNHMMEKRMDSKNVYDESSMDESGADPLETDPFHLEMMDYISKQADYDCPVDSPEPGVVYLELDTSEFVGDEFYQEGGAPLCLKACFRYTSRICVRLETSLKFLEPHDILGLTEATDNDKCYCEQWGATISRLVRLVTFIKRMSSWVD